MKAYSALKLQSSTRPQIVMEIYKGEKIGYSKAVTIIETGIRTNYRQMERALEDRLFRLSELAPYNPYQDYSPDYDEDFDKEKDKINNALAYLEKLKNRICQK